MSDSFDEVVARLTATRWGIINQIVEDGNLYRECEADIGRDGLVKALEGAGIEVDEADWCMQIASDARWSDPSAYTGFPPGFAMHLIRVEKVAKDLGMGEQEMAAIQAIWDVLGPSEDA